MWILEGKLNPTNVTKGKENDVLFAIKTSQSFTIGTSKECDLTLPLTIHAPKLLELTIQGKAVDTTPAKDATTPLPLHLTFCAPSSRLPELYVDGQPVDDTRTVVLTALRHRLTVGHTALSLRWVPLVFSLAHLPSDRAAALTAWLAALGCAVDATRGTPVVATRAHWAHRVWRHHGTCVPSAWVRALPHALRRPPCLARRPPPVLRNVSVHFAGTRRCDDAPWAELVASCGGTLTTAPTADVVVWTEEDEERLLDRMLLRREGGVVAATKPPYVALGAFASVRPETSSAMPNFKRFKLNHVPFLPNLIEVSRRKSSISLQVSLAN